MGEALAKYWLVTSVDETDSDSGVTWTKKNKPQGKLSDIFWLLTSVGKTDTDSGGTGTRKKKRYVFFHLSIKT